MGCTTLQFISSSWVIASEYPALGETGDMRGRDDYPVSNVEPGSRSYVAMLVLADHQHNSAVVVRVQLVKCFAQFHSGPLGPRLLGTMYAKCPTVNRWFIRTRCRIRRECRHGCLVHLAGANLEAMKPPVRGSRHETGCIPKTRHDSER